MGTQKVLVGGSSLTAGQMKDFWRQVDDGSINGLNLQAFLDHKDPSGLDTVVIDWKKVYQALGMKDRLEEANIFIEPDPSFWDVYVVNSVTPNEVVKALRDLGVTVDLYTNNLDTDVPTNDCSPANGSYRVRFKKTVEADPELADKSAKVLEKEGVKGITLLERLLLELGYFLATGNHLDVDNITLCSGSRNSGGDVPRVYWLTVRRGVHVGWCRVSYSHPVLRSRAVVS